MKLSTFIEVLGGRLHGLNLKGDDGEAVAGDRVTDFGHDFGDGDELVGVAGEGLAALDDSIGVDDGDGYALGGLAALDEHFAGGD